jgi:N-acetylglucosamine kinase-like BadF-type ATPase
MTASGRLVLDDRVTLPSRANAADPGGPAEVAATIAQAVAEVGGNPSILVVAAAGALYRPSATALAERLAGSYAEVAVTSDVVAAHAAAFGGGSGVVLAVGTGAVALAVRADGRYTLVDGRGYLLGDAGGGFSIGRAGLVAALRHGDGRTGGSAALATAAVARFGPLDQLPYVLQGATDAPRQIASFVPEVGGAARAGDPVAEAIWREAAAELAETVAAACGAGIGSGCQVALVGSLSEVDDLLVAPLRASLATRCPGVRVDAAAPEILAGVATLARPVPAYEALIVRRR